MPRPPNETELAQEKFAAMRTKLINKGIDKDPGESPLQFLNRVKQEHPGDKAVIACDKAIYRFLAMLQQQGMDAQGMQVNQEAICDYGEAIFQAQQKGPSHSVRRPGD